MAFIHQGIDEKGSNLLGALGLEDVDSVSDPGLRLYRAFGLGRMTPGQFLSPLVWWRGFQTAVLRKHGFGRVNGDEFQMPGVFLVHRGIILRSHVYRELWDHPDFVSMASIPAQPQHGA